MCLRSAFDASIAQPVDKNVHEPKHVILPTRLVVRVAHADQGTQQIFRANVVADFACGACSTQEAANRSRQKIRIRLVNLRRPSPEAIGGDLRLRQVKIGYAGGVRG